MTSHLRSERLKGLAERSGVVIAVLLGLVGFGQVLGLASFAGGQSAALAQGVASQQMVKINVPARPEAPPALRLGANQPVELHLSSDQRLLGTGTTDADGALVIEIPLPRDLTTGTYTIEVKGASAAGSPISVDHEIDVTSVASQVKPSPADNEDSPSSISTLLAALALAFVAGNLVFIQRFVKRRSASFNSEEP